MRLFVCTDHAHHNPVGVASVVVAEDEATARELLEAELRAHGLDPAKPFTIQEIPLGVSSAHVLCDGEY